MFYKLSKTDQSRVLPPMVGPPAARFGAQPSRDSISSPSLGFPKWWYPNLDGIYQIYPIGWDQIPFPMVVPIIGNDRIYHPYHPNIMDDWDYHWAIGRFDLDVFPMEKAQQKG